MNITFLNCVVELPDTTNKEVVKVMHQFFEYANEAANREFLASGDLGWSKLPYNSTQIENAKQHAELAKADLAGHKAMLAYFMGKIFEQIS